MVGVEQHPSAITSVATEAQEELYHHMLWNPEHADPALLVNREWLVTNGLGGYASGTIAGVPTRRYHGLLIAALPVPLGRMVMLNRVAEEFRLMDGTTASLEGTLHGDGTLDIPGGLLREFRLESGLPIWLYDIGGFLLEKRILMPHLQNTTYVVYRLLEGPGPLRLRIRPSVHFRRHEAAVTAGPEQYAVSALNNRIEITAGELPPLRMRLVSPRGAMVLDGGAIRELHYPLERARGYESKGNVWCPGYFRTDLVPGQHAALVASTENWDVLSLSSVPEAMEAEQYRRQRLLSAAHRGARSGFPAQLALGADQFIIAPSTRPADAARAAAMGDQIRSVIAGYHWFTDWGRDTMISLEGLTLLTGRYEEAGYILRAFGFYIRDGLIPNLFPEGGHEGLYHTADATLWFFHALDRYVQTTGDRYTLRTLVPKLRDVLDQHFRGTRFGIRVDPDDGLLAQGQPGYQLTWMDAKVGDWVVTPRRGKAVEINALWYNALRLMERWHREEQAAEAADCYARAAERAATAFNERFWYEGGGYLYDVVDGEQGDDSSMRPNQIFAISLPHPVLDRQRWLPVLEQVTRRLLTPMGLRSLAPGHPDYKATYDGDLRARDAAYHQGTVWAWLIGPFVDAWLKVHPDDWQTADDFLAGFEGHLGEACIGSISEVFDAEAPYTPRGCVAQAWSVAEVLRAWVKTHPLASADASRRPTLEPRDPRG